VSDKVAGRGEGERKAGHPEPSRVGVPDAAAEGGAPVVI